MTVIEPTAAPGTLGGPPTEYRGGSTSSFLTSKYRTCDPPSVPVTRTSHWRHLPSGLLGAAQGTAIYSFASGPFG